MGLTCHHGNTEEGWGVGWGRMACAEKMAASKTNVVLLSCGSFNPVTFMHLRMFGKFAKCDLYVNT